MIDENGRVRARRFPDRGLLGADRSSGALAVGDTVRVGQTVRFHVRDAQSADEDLRQVLALQNEALAGRTTAGALLFTCNGRGSQMFPVADHDAARSPSLSAPRPSQGSSAQARSGRRRSQLPARVHRDHRPLRW